MERSSLHLKNNPAILDAVFDARSKGLSFRAIAKHLRVLGVDVSHVTVGSMLKNQSAKLPKEEVSGEPRKIERETLMHGRRYSRNKHIGTLPTDEYQIKEYISQSAVIGLNVHQIESANIKPGIFMKMYPEMVVAWSQYGHTYTEIANTMSLSGIRVSERTVRELMPQIRELANTLIVEDIVSEMKLLSRERTMRAYQNALDSNASEKYMSQSEDINRGSTERKNVGRENALASDIVSVRPSSSNISLTRQNEQARPATVNVVPKPLPTNYSPFSVARVEELAKVPGEDEDMSNRLSTSYVPCSFGDFRRALWADYTSDQRKNLARMPCGSEPMVMPKLVAPLLRGDYKNWSEYFAAMKKRNR